MKRRENEQDKQLCAKVWWHFHLSFMNCCVSILRSGAKCTWKLPDVVYAYMACLEFWNAVTDVCREPSFVTLLLDQEMFLLLLPMGGKVLLVIRTRSLECHSHGICRSTQGLLHWTEVFSWVEKDATRTEAWKWGPDKLKLGMRHLMPRCRMVYCWSKSSGQWTFHYFYQKKKKGGICY